MGRMKRWGAALALLFCISVYAPAARAISSSGELSEETVRLSVGIFDENMDEYVSVNRTVTAEWPVSANDTLALLEKEGWIVGFEMEDERLLAITSERDGEPAELRETNQFKFYVKRNGLPLLLSQQEEELNDGDLIEWIYTTTGRYDSTQEPPVSAPPEEPAPPAELWTPEAAEVLNAACDWLDQNAASGEGYLIAAGSAGRAAPIDAVNTLLAQVRKAESHEQSSELVQKIISLSFCGFDAENPDLSRLLGELMSYGALEKQGISGLSGALAAYDSRGYQVPDNVKNSRERLIQSLLALQDESGGFSARGNVSPTISDTADAVTVLAEYRFRPEVEAALQKGIEYLAAGQLDSGGYQAMGRKDGKLLAKVIAALASADVSAEDERFTKNGDLLSLLLDYQQSDGGFSQASGGESDADTTMRVVLALVSVKKGGNPCRVSSALHSSVPVPDTAPTGVRADSNRGVLIAVALLLILIAAAVTAVFLLRREKRGKD